MLDKVIIERCVIDYKVIFFLKLIFFYNDCYLYVYFLKCIGSIEWNFFVKIDIFSTF